MPNPFDDLIPDRTDGGIKPVSVTPQPSGKPRSWPPRRHLFNPFDDIVKTPEAPAANPFDDIIQTAEKAKKPNPFDDIVPESPVAKPSFKPQEVERPQLEIGPPKVGQRKATQSEMDQLKKSFYVNLARKYPRDYMGGSKRIEALAKGISPIKSEKDSTAYLEEAYPLESAAGDLIGLIGMGKLLGGVAPAVSGSSLFNGLDKMGKIGLFARFAGGRMAQSASAFGAKELLDNLFEMAGGKKKGAREVTEDVLGQTIFGAGLGLTGSVPKAVYRIPAEAAYGYGVAKLSGADNLSAGINGALYGLFGLFNRKNVDQAFMKESITGIKKAIFERAVDLGYDPGKAAAFVNMAERHIYNEVRKRGGELTLKDWQKIAREIADGAKIGFPEPMKPAQPAPKPLSGPVTPPPPAETAAPTPAPQSTQKTAPERQGDTLTRPETTAKTATSFFRTSRAMPWASPEKKARLDALEEKLDNTVNRTERRALLQQIRALIDDISKDKPAPEQPSDPSPTRQSSVETGTASQTGQAPKPTAPKKTPIKLDIPENVSEEEARQIFFFDEGDTVEKAILKGLREEIKAGEAGGKIYDEEEGRITGGFSSTFPEYFRNKGYSQAETLRIISSVLDDKPITERQKGILSDLVDGFIEKTRKEAEFYAQREAEELQAEEGKSLEETQSPSELQKENRGASDLEGTDKALEPQTAYNPREAAPAFYSHLEKTIEQKMPNSAPVSQVRGLLTSAGVKQDEMDWLDIEGFLSGKEKVSKKEILDYVRANQVEIKEIQKGSSSPEPLKWDPLGNVLSAFEGSGDKKVSFTIEKLMNGRFLVDSGAGMRQSFETLEEAKAHAEQIRKNVLGS
ncbi:MAG TPA: hypothetical protein VFK27_03235, partial [Bacillales bacterium]|nr:hypothetical protein [Bacillales bacterium]